MAPRAKKPPMNFTSMQQSDVPQGRKGKHNAIVTRIVSDLGSDRGRRRAQGAARRLTESKEKVRSALTGRLKRTGIASRPPAMTSTCMSGTKRHDGAAADILVRRHRFVRRHVHPNGVVKGTVAGRAGDDGASRGAAARRRGLTNRRGRHSESIASSTAGGNHCHARRA